MQNTKNLEPRIANIELSDSHLHRKATYPPTPKNKGVNRGGIGKRAKMFIDRIDLLEEAWAISVRHVQSSKKLKLNTNSETRAQ